MGLNDHARLSIHPEAEGKEIVRAKIALVVLALLLLTSTALAQQAAPPDLLIYNLWVRPTAPALADGATPEPPIPGTVTGAYMTIENTGSTDYHLVSASDDFTEMTQLHQMTMDDKGVMRMSMVDQVDIPAGQTVTLASTGGYHVMLMNVTHDLYPGDAVALTLTFADSSGATFDVPVAALATDDAPTEDMLIAANALAQPAPDDPTALDVTLVLDNRGASGDSINGASSDLAGTVNLMHFAESGTLPFESIYVPPQTQTPLTTDTAFIRLSDLPDPLPEALPLTLSFASGKTVTIAVPIAGAQSPQVTEAAP